MLLVKRNCQKGLGPSIKMFCVIWSKGSVLFGWSKSGSDKLLKSSRRQVRQSILIGRCVSLGRVGDRSLDAAQPYSVTFSSIYRVGQSSVVKRSKFSRN